jgi:membrane protein YdbS with pleckstrin-like domain
MKFWSLNKIVLLTLHLFVWVLLHAFIARSTNYLVNYDDAFSIISLYAVSLFVNVLVFVKMFRQMLCIYVGMYDARSHS